MDAGRRRSKKCNRQRRGPLGAEGSEGLKPKKALNSFIRAGSSQSATPLLFHTPQKVPLQLTLKWQISLRANLGGGCRGCAPSSPSEMTCGFLMQLVFAKCCMRVSRNKEWRRGRGKRIPPCCFSCSFSFCYPHNMNAWNMLDKEKPLFL